MHSFPGLYHLHHASASTFKLFTLSLSSVLPIRKGEFINTWGKMDISLSPSTVFYSTRFKQAWVFLFPNAKGKSHLVPVKLDDRISGMHMRLVN